MIEKRSMKIVQCRIPRDNKETEKMERGHRKTKKGKHLRRG